MIMQIVVRMIAFVAALCFLFLWFDREDVVQAPEEPEPEEMVIKVHPVQEEMVESEPETSEPEPPAVVEPEPEPVAVESEPEAHPVPALSESKVPDHLPAISAAYKQTIGFQGYVRAMHAIGGRFYIYDDTRNKLLDGVDPLTRKTETVDTDRLNGLSPRLREIGYEPSMDVLLNAYQSEHPRSRIKLALLLPQSVEHRIAKQLTHAFEEAMLPGGRWLRAEAEYQLVAGFPVLDLQRLIGVEGQQEVSLRLALK